MATKSSDQDFHFPIPMRKTKPEKENNTSSIESSSNEGFSGVSPAEKSQLNSCDKTPVEKSDFSLDIPTKAEYSKRFEKSLEQSLESSENPVEEDTCDKYDECKLSVLMEKLNLVLEKLTTENDSGSNSLQTKINTDISKISEENLREERSVFESRFLNEVEKSILPENIKVVVLKVCEILATKANYQTISERNYFHNTFLMKKFSKIEDHYKDQKNMILAKKAMNNNEFTLLFTYPHDSLIENSYEYSEVELCKNHPIKNVLVEELIKVAKDNGYIVKNDIINNRSVIGKPNPSIDWIEFDINRKITFIKME